MWKVIHNYITSMYNNCISGGEGYKSYAFETTTAKYSSVAQHHTMYGAVLQLRTYVQITAVHTLHKPVVISTNTFFFLEDGISPFPR